MKKEFQTTTVKIINVIDLKDRKNERERERERIVIIVQRRNVQFRLFFCKRLLVRVRSWTVVCSVVPLPPRPPSCPAPARLCRPQVSTPTRGVKPVESDWRMPSPSSKKVHAPWNRNRRCLCRGIPPTLEQRAKFVRLPQSRSVNVPRPSGARL